MTKLTIAVTNSYNDTVTLVPVQCDLSDNRKAVFHSSPRVDFDGKDILRNFDYHFDFGMKANELHQELLPNNYFHYPRVKRMPQYVKLYHFNKKYAGIHPEIFIPEYYLATQQEGEHVKITNFSLPKSEKVVIKEVLGARGSKQVVVPANMLTTLLKETQGLTMDEVRTKFPDLVYSESTDFDSIFFNKTSDLFISELVTGVTNEWRILVGGNNLYARERTIKQGPYPQANLDTEVFHTVAEVIYKPIETMFDEDLCAMLHDMVKFINLPIGSVDLFLTEEGKYGIFEYSTQYAFHGADPRWVRQIIVDGLTMVIDNHPSDKTKDTHSAILDTKHRASYEEVKPTKIEGNYPDGDWGVVYTDKGTTAQMYPYPPSHPGMFDNDVTLPPVPVMRTPPETYVDLDIRNKDI